MSLSPLTFIDVTWSAERCLKVWFDGSVVAEDRVVVADVVVVGVAGVDVDVDDRAARGR